MKTLITFIMILTLNSCGSDGDKVSEDVLITPITGAPEDIEEVKEEIAYDCSSELEVVTLDITIPASTKSCEWGKNGNLSKRNTYTRAKSETPTYFVLPNYQTVCGLEITSEREEFKYDDHIYLTLNNSVLFSSYPNHMEDLTIEGSKVPQFNWEKLKNTKFTNNDYERFCLGSDMGSYCHFPQTQRTGEMKIKIIDEVIQEVVALNIDRDTHILIVIVTGDNDASDCKHSEINVQLEIKVPKMP